MTSSVVATSTHGHAMIALVRLLSASSTFQERRGVSSSAEAEQYIYWPWLQSELVEESWPCAIIEEGADVQNMVAGGAVNQFLPFGSLILTLTDKDRYPDQHHDSWMDFRNFCDAVILDLLEKAGSDDYLDVTRTECVQKAMHSDPTSSVRPHWSAKWEISWGVEGGQ